MIKFYVFIMGILPCIWDNVPPIQFNQRKKNSLFIVLSLVAALLLPINRIIEVKSLPTTHQDSATLHSGVADCHYLLIIPLIRVSIINFNHGEGIGKQNKTR